MSKTSIFCVLEIFSLPHEFTFIQKKNLIENVSITKLSVQLINLQKTANQNKGNRKRYKC